MRTNQPITSNEHVFGDDVAIISHTDAEGRITFVNDDFVAVSGFDDLRFNAPVLDEQFPGFLLPTGFP